MHKLNSFINELENNILLFDKLNTKISLSTVGWHIEHSLKVVVQITEALEKSNPNDYKWRFNTWRTIVLTSGKIPRGRGKAPKTVIPEGELNMEMLKLTIEKSKLSIKKIDNLSENNYFKHPYFGNLNVKPTKKFLSIHTNHHLKIIKAIIK